MTGGKWLLLLGAIQLICGIILAITLPYAGIHWTGSIATMLPVFAVIGGGIVSIIFAPSVAASRLPNPYFILLGAIWAAGVLGFVIWINYGVNEMTLAKNSCLPRADPSLNDRIGTADCDKLTARIWNDNLQLLTMLGLCFANVGAATLYLAKARNLVYA